jgi:hypothetical protein
MIYCRMTKFNLKNFLIVFLISSCNNNLGNKVNEAKNETTEIQAVVPKDNCKCIDGIGSSKGDAPILEIKLNNGENISVCGFLDTEMEGMIYSEFNVFECSSGKSLAEFDATQFCRVIKKPDTLLIQELKYLPAGKGWTWNLIQIGEQIITTKDNKTLLLNCVQNLRNLLSMKMMLKHF